MKILVYGALQEGKEIADMIRTIGFLQYRRLQFSFMCSYDEYIKALKTEIPDLVLVVADGADGMEGMHGVREIAKDVPVIWLSDDGGFAPYSFRVGASFFAKKPVTEEMLVTALKHCAL